MSSEGERSVEASESAFVPVREARARIGRPGTPVATQTVFSLAVRGELDVRMIAGRFVVTQASIDAYRARHDEATQA